MGWLVHLFQVLSSCGSTLMILSLVPTVFGIHKAKCTGHAPITPFATMLVNCHLWMMYGYLDRNWVPLFACFLFGDAVSLTYLSFYYRYTRDRAYAHKIFAACAVVITTTTTYAVLGGLGYTGQSHETVVSTMGYIGIAASVLLYSSPFENIGKVWKYRSGVFIPIFMVSVGAVNSAVWVIYSLLANDWFILGPNVFTLSMGIAQVAVYLLFNPRSHPPDYGVDTKGDLEQGRDAATQSYLPVQSPLEPVRGAT